MDLRFLFSAHRPIMLYMCTKLRENISNCVNDVALMDGQTDIKNLEMWQGIINICSATGTL